jgi:hypothetical protein
VLARRAALKKQALTLAAEQKRISKQFNSMGRVYAVTFPQAQ